VDSGATKNYISLIVIKWLRMPHKQKQHLYLLVIILKHLIAYRGGIINLQIELITLSVKGRVIIINFNILLLKNIKVILEMF